MNELRQKPSHFASSSVASRGDVRDLNVARVRALLSERPTRWLDGAIGRLDELCSLPVGWNGYGAGPVAFATAYFAMGMLKSVCGPEAPTPSIVPGVNGDLQVEWHLKSGDVELHVRAPNDVHAWREIAGTEGSEELILTNDFTNIVSWVKDLTEPASAVVSAAA